MFVLREDKADVALQGESKEQGWGNATKELAAWGLPLRWRRPMGDGTSPIPLWHR